MWNAICYSAEYKQKFSSLELCQQLPLRFSRFPGDISTPSHIKVNQGSQIKTIFKNNNNKKRLTGKRLDLPVFSGLCLPFGLHSPGREASASHQGRATQLSPDAKKTWSYREDGHNQPWNCGRVGDRLIIHSCVQEQLR